MIELGRYIVGEAGVYVTRVVDRKESRGKTFLVVDGGMHHQLAASGNFGQVIRRNYPVAIGNRARRRARPRPSASSAACARRSTCSPTTWRCRAADVGDLVVVFQAGAYGLTASPTAFLSHPAPARSAGLSLGSPSNGGAEAPRPGGAAARVPRRAGRGRLVRRRAIATATGCPTAGSGSTASRRSRPRPSATPIATGSRNRREYRLRTNPRRADTDRDGLSDGAEIKR